MRESNSLLARAIAAYQKAEIEKWWPIVKEANIKTDESVACMGGTR
jgi:hypothetical protein